MAMTVQESTQESMQDRLAMGAQGASAISASDVVDIGEQARLSARRRERLMSIGSPLGLLLAWEIAARFGWIDIRFFPAPSTIVGVMVRMAQSGELLEHVLISMQRISLGFLLGGVPAVLLGVLMGISRPVRALVDPLIIATYPIPKSSLLPFILLIFGLGEMSKVVMVAIGVFFPVAINATAGVLQISPIYLDVGKSFKASRWDTFRTIALPGALPFIMTGIKLGAGLALILIAIAEMVGAKSGIGYMIWSAWETFAVAKMYVGLFVIAIIGFVLSLLLNELERWVIRWKAEA
jgi:ABC-type nitrate/sulfonate/bicarbonate transport system permease component